ncbi:DUF423 domain-containing protein [Pseudoxanthomonas sp. JBR18]|uniref:DUF423 domain-containing protein n=1 Tax=Pseudoxanthomonas sp. JBR18 TaxID=2969308 RepID=UPI00230543D0|nr:DUF423 domain-containing protein [Pseudoxanthomonas sp. JBR18]WCE03596.1 DUF423 domain-containing protein [Pseudoxanthomonas sp. JBR18]
MSRHEKGAGALRLWSILAGLSGASAVAIAAWASHGLAQSVSPEPLPRALEQARSEGLQQLVHTLALLGVALAGQIRSSPWLHLAGVLFLAAIVGFSFGIYALHLWWPALAQGSARYVVPAGGVSFILGWLALASAGLFPASGRP